MLAYRLARPEDAQLYFSWANDPETRQQSFNSAPVSLETHVAWFTNKLHDPCALLFVFEDDFQNPVGQVRFERKTFADMPDEVVIGISIDSGFRGKGLASELIRLSCQACGKEWGQVAINAYIKPENQASIRAFEKAGFVFSGESGKFGIASLVYTLST